ncbi:O-methyltransferase [Seiridium cupressi]
MSTSRSIASSSGSSGLRAAERKLNTPPKFVTEAQQTLLYFRAVDADDPESILNDIYAKQLINKIPLGIVDTMGQDLRYVKFWCLRAKRIDWWCRDFMMENPECTVVNLSCGLDTRNHRLQPPASVRWFDVDHPEVLEFRNRVISRPGGDYRTTAIDIADDDPSWIYAFPKDRPTLVIAESNMFYLKPQIAKGIFYTIAEHFSHGQITFDVLGSMCASLINMKMATAQKNSGMKILWPVNDPRVLTRIHPKIRFIDEMRYSDDMPPWFGEFKTKLLKMLPAYRNLGRVILLSFGEANRGLEDRPFTSHGGDSSSSYTSSGRGYTTPGSLSRSSTFMRD